MKKYLFYLFLSLFLFNCSFAKDVNIQENINLTFKCILDKKIIKNSEYNYKTFFAEDLDKKVLENLKIESKQPETLNIIGLSNFLSTSEELNVKVVNKEVVLFKSIDEKNNYSESAIIDRNTGELVHEITINFESENSEKDIFFFTCNYLNKNV
tara:strand:- start:20 stop:481 length:462 start_codon:yes stop_codon:yes gene_type:complete